MCISRFSIYENEDFLFNEDSIKFFEGLTEIILLFLFNILEEIKESLYVILVRQKEHNSVTLKHPKFNSSWTTKPKNSMF